LLAGSRQCNVTNIMDQCDSLWKSELMELRA
jgi:hypothetical protein